MVCYMQNMPTAPVNVRLRGSDSHGHLALIEIVVAAGSEGPPLHVHPLHGEGFYVLEGQLTVRVGDDVSTAQAGSFVFAPQNAPHTFANFSSDNARMLVFCAPAGYETYFDQLAEGKQAVPPAGYSHVIGPSLARPGPET